MGKAIAATIPSALHPPQFKAVVRDRVEYEEVGNISGQVIGVMNRSKTERQITGKYETGRPETSWKTAGNGNTRFSGKQENA